MKIAEKREKQYRRHKRVRAKISGTDQKLRLYVFRSLNHIYGQLINDDKRITIINASDLEIKKLGKKSAVTGSGGKGAQEGEKKEIRSGKIALAYTVGKLIAEKAIKEKISKVVFDRGGYKYHGRVKALAEGARDGGLIF